MYWCQWECNFFLGYFKNIKLINYRNFIDSSFAFDDGCNVIIGKNGSGKTNILEAISLFEKGRGFRKDKIINFINFEIDRSLLNLREKLVGFKCIFEWYFSDTHNSIISAKIFLSLKI